MAESEIQAALRTSLSSLRVVDLGIGMACALLAKFLVEAGASVVRIEPPQGDPFDELYPANRCWQIGKSFKNASAANLSDELADADICILGGEDYPGLDWRHDARDLSNRFPRLVVVDVAGSVAPGDGDPTLAVDLLVQATTGLVYEQKPDRPLFHTLLDPSYGAALQGLIGALAALLERERSGLGQIVSTSLQQGTLAWRAMRWFHASGIAPGELSMIPKGSRQLICQCADGQYIHFTKGGRGASLRLNNILGISDDSVTIDTPSINLADERGNVFGDLDLIAAHVARWDTEALLAAFHENGITAERVLSPGQCWADPQVRHNQIISVTADGSRYVGFPIAATAVVKNDSSRPNAKAGGSPLQGIRILDLGSYVAGPSVSRLLGDLGADVIKLEPLIGDPARILLPSFAMANRGKEAITVDLKTPEGAEILRKLCLDSDIVHHNFRAEIARRLGVDAPTLQRLKSDLIVLETTGYGMSGPDAARPAFDMVLQAFCGHEQRFGGVGNRPEWNMFASVDIAAGMIGAVALLLALLRRATSGEALALDVNLLNTSLYLMSELVQRPDGSFAGAATNNQTQTGLHPAERLYEALDGWIAVAARSEAMAARFARVLGLETAGLRCRTAWDETEACRLAGAIRKRNIDDLIESLTAADVWVAKCRRDPMRDLLWNSGLEATDAVIVSEDSVIGATRQIGSAFQLSRSPLPLAGKAHVPAPGEHTARLLDRLGYAAGDIAELYERRVVA